MTAVTGRRGPGVAGPRPPFGLGSLLETVGERLRLGLVDLAWFSVFHPRTVLVLIFVVTAAAGLLASRLHLATSVTDLRRIHVDFAGAPATLLDDRDLIVRDAATISVVSFLAQLALFLWSFRRAGPVLVAGASMLVGAIWTLGFAGLAVGEINVFTAGSIGILLGLSGGFSVHVYNRYLEEVWAGRDMLKAFTLSHGETGLGIVASVAVMVVGFAAASGSSFRGLRDLGVICGAGLLLSLLATLSMIPALTALTARRRRARSRAGRSADPGLPPLPGVVVRRPRTTIVVSALVAVLFSIPAPSIRLEEDLGVGAPFVAQAVRPLVLRDGTIASLVACAGALLILAASFRRPRLVLLTALPLVVGLTASAGVMRLLGVEFNLVTVSMLPPIIGIAIGSGIHVVHRYVEGTEDVAGVLRHSGRGVVLASLTTIAGFAALLIADDPALVSPGVLAMLGTGFAMLASLTLLPALLVLDARRTVRRRSGAREHGQP